MRLTVVGLSLLMAVAMVTAEEKKFFALFSKELRNGMDFIANVILPTAATSNLDVYVSIRKTSSATSDIAFTGSDLTIRIASGQTQGSASVMVPFELPTGSEYYVHYSFPESFSLTTKLLPVKVVVYRPKLPLFIITDKSVYKSGDEVLFRGLGCDQNLRPTDSTLTYEIKDSNGKSIMKETSHTETDDAMGGYGNSLLDGSFKLSDNPAFGMYKILLNTDVGYTEAQFEVKEYVLPRFEVIVELDWPYATQGDNSISGRIQGKYSFGQPVLGNVSVKIAMGNEDFTQVKASWKKDNFDGSATFTAKLDTSRWVMPYMTDSYKTESTLKVRAELQEKNTANVESAEVPFKIYAKPFAAAIMKPLPTLFQGHKDVTFSVKLTNPEGGQLTDWDTDNDGSDSLSNYELYYKSGSDRDFMKTAVTSNPQEVTVKLNTTDDDIYRNTVEAYVQYKSKSSGAATIIDSQYVKENVAKYYTHSKETIDVELVPSNNENERCFKLTPFKAGDTAYYQVVNNYEQELVQPYTNAAGHCITLEHRHAPKSRFLVYKPVDYTDGKLSGTELLASSVDITMDWSPEQTVLLTVTDSPVKPGEMVDITIQTDGKALVGYKGVDISVSFMADPNDLTLRALEDAATSFSPFDRKKDNPNPHPPMFPVPFGLRGPVAKRKKRCSACTSMDTYLDTRKLIEYAGLSIVTNFNLKRRDDFIYSSTGGGFGDDRVFMAAGGGPMLEKSGSDYPEFREFAMALPNMEADFGNDYENYALAERLPVFDMAYEDAGNDFYYDIMEAMPMEGGGPPLFDKAEGDSDGDVLEQADDDEAEADEEDAGGKEKVRDFFPETWLWDMKMTDDNGNLNLREEVPDTITKWQVSAFGLNSAKGLSVSETKEITVFQEIFLSMNLPYSVVRTEQVDIDMIVFNYKSTAIKVTVDLETASANYTIKDDSRLNKPYTIAPGTSILVTAKVEFTKIGEIPLKATARQVESQSNAVDIVVRQLPVLAEGREIIEEDNVQVALSQQNNNIEQEFNMSKFFLETGFVQGSLRIYLYVTGDMMGPFIVNIVLQIRMPYGCGEQNIKSLTPSVFVARYLIKINKMDEKIMNKVRQVCRAGVNKQFNYLHADGSFSAFGDTPNVCICGVTGKKKGSTWLTAYVLKTFSLLVIDDITYVSPDLLQRSFNYIKNNVTYEGCSYQYFVEEGQLIHTEMKGGSSTRFGFVAFVLDAIMEYRRAALKAGLTDTVREADKLIEGATAWLQSQKEELLRSKEPYQLAIVAYVLARANEVSPDPTSVFLLQELEKVLNGESKPSPSNEECRYSPSGGESKRCRSDGDCMNNMECCQVACQASGTKLCSRKPYRRFISGDKEPETVVSESSMIETKGYALMAYLQLYKVETDNTKKNMYKTKIEVLKKWLLSKRKSNGFFSSTQDTVVALQSLAMYAMVFSENEGTFRVTGKADGNTVTDEVVVTRDQYTVTQERKLDLDTPPESLSVVVSGSSGTAYVNLAVYYNVAKNVTKVPAFDVDIKPINVDNMPAMRLCFKKNQAFKGQSGAMIVNSVDLISGYEAQDVKAEEKTNSKLAPTKFEYENDRNKVNIYYMEEDDEYFDLRCAHIFYKKKIPVEKPQQRVVIVRDYYIEENSLEVLYMIDPEQGTELRTTTQVTTGASSAHMSLFLLVASVFVVTLARLINLE